MRKSDLILVLPLASMTLGAFLIPEAYASFNCEHIVDAPVPMLSCKSTGISDDQSEAWISLRKMPAWGTNAGLTIVDLCLESNNSNIGSHNPTFSVSQDYSLDEHNSEHNCMRRYCTDKKSAFSFFINSIPFPIGWTMIRFRFGREAQSFSISCDEFSQRI